MDLDTRIVSVQKDISRMKDRQYALEARVDSKMASLDVDMKGLTKDISHIQEFRNDTRANFTKVIWLVILTGLIPLVKDVISV
jgi:hypothetical protein